MRRSSSRLQGLKRALVSIGLIGLAAAGGAWAYVGPSYLQLVAPGAGQNGDRYKNWIWATANYWSPSGTPTAGFGMFGAFPGPSAPRQGAGKLVIAIDKRSPALRGLMDKCLGKAAIAEMTYAESSDLARSIYEIGARPATVPPYFEYRLKGVRISDCPVVADAPEQAFVISFDAIEWLNYHFKENVVPPLFKPVALRPAATSSTTRTFVLTWFGVAHDVSDDQCPVMAARPDQEEYFTYLAKSDADKERARLAPAGPSYSSDQMSMRGPNRLNVCKLPGIVPDPGQPGPRTDVARGLDLDGNDGSGKPPPGIRKHRNFVSSEGMAGIDNQLYAAQGCIAGLLGHRGYNPQFANSQMRDGNFSILVQITGLDDERNDDAIEVTWFYSQDPMAKNAAGTTILRDYTFRVTTDPQYTHYFKRFKGRIVDGVAITDPVEQFTVNMGKYGLPSERPFLDARLRLTLLPDGGIKGVVGGYQDVWRLTNQINSSRGEQQFGYQCPAIYSALKRFADGRRDPATGDYTAISAAYDIEGIPAFVAPAAAQVAVRDR